MEFGTNLKAFLKRLPLKKMTGHQKFLAVAAFDCKGRHGTELATKNIQSEWRKSILKSTYNPSYYGRAQTEGWVNPNSTGRGRFSVAKEGIDHLEALAIHEQDFSEGALEKSGSLIIVNRKGTHSFDKYIRKLFAEAQSQVLIADSYVDGTIFDTVLDVIPKAVTIKFLYKKQSDNFEQRAQRFGKQYTNFHIKKHANLHDRFLVIDSSGYIIGPSLKDAASNSPALAVVLTGKEKQRLQSFFDELWRSAK